jgi:phage terminase Nu1 subunit (DNA packaging protein)
MAGRRPGKKPTTPSGLPETCSRSDLAHILGIAVRTVADWDQKGVFERAVGRGRYYLVASVNGYTAALREQAAGRASATGLQLTDERALTEQVVREIRKLELAKVQREVLTLDEVSSSWSKFAAAVKARVLTIPGRSRSSIPHLTPQDAEIMKNICRDVLLDLAEEVDATVVYGDGKSIESNDR